MTEASPHVTILIATKDRPEELRLTLRDMGRQDYQALDMLVIDDASNPPVQSVVHECWPGAAVVRHEMNAGQCARNLAQGEFLLQLHHDCSFRSGVQICAAPSSISARILKDAHLPSKESEALSIRNQLKYHHVWQAVPFLNYSDIGPDGAYTPNKCALPSEIGEWQW